MSVNKVIIVGNVGKDPEIRYMPSGDAVANLTVATSDKYKSKETGELVDATEWHRISMFGRLAEIAGEYLRKGSLVYIEGSLRTRKWTDKDGAEKYSTEIRADNMQMLGGKPQGDQQSGRDNAPRNQAQGTPGGRGAQQDQYQPQQQGRGAPPARSQAPQGRSAPPPRDSGYPDDSDVQF